MTPERAIAEREGELNREAMQLEGSAERRRQIHAVIHTELARRPKHLLVRTGVRLAEMAQTVMASPPFIDRLVEKWQEKSRGWLTGDPLDLPTEQEQDAMILEIQKESGIEAIRAILQSLAGSAKAVKVDHEALSAREFDLFVDAHCAALNVLINSPSLSPPAPVDGLTRSSPRTNSEPDEGQEEST